MAEAGTLHDAFIDELRDTYDAEKQLTKALPKLAKAATNAKLRAAFESHLKETQGQIARLEQVFESLDEKVRGKHCDGIAGIIEEGKSVMEEDFDETTMDACLIAAGQRAEHYEMAAYGTLVAWAQAMGHTEAAKLLQQTLDEEKAADKKLSGLAEGGINQSAADAAHPDEETRSRSGQARAQVGRVLPRGKRDAASTTGDRMSKLFAIAEPGSAAARQRLRLCTCDGATGSERQDPIRSDPEGNRRPRHGDGTVADRRHQRSGIRGFGSPGCPGGADGEPPRDPEAARQRRRRADDLHQRQLRAVALGLSQDGRALHLTLLAGSSCVASA